MFKCSCPHEVRSGCSEPKCPHYMPRMVRHVIDGHEVLLPSDAKLNPPSDDLGGCYD